MVKRSVVLLLLGISTLMASAQELYINAKTGNDANPGSKLQPLKTIVEAAKRINIDHGKETATINLADGVYPLMETALFNNNRFTAEHRLTIRAEILPDDSNWSPQHMPIVTAVIPGLITPGDGEEAKGLQIEASHVTIAGLRFTGSPVYYYIDAKQSRRYYPIWRDGKNLEDLVVTQCVFAGNMDVSPIRVAVIANGHGLVLDHCVFFNCQNPVVFWDAEGGTSYHNAMRYCLVYEGNYSGVWTTGSTADDLEFHHNIIANSRIGWIRDKNSTHHYKIHDCIIAGNQNVAGYGNGQGTTNNDFVTLDNVQLTGVIEIEKDQSKNNYLQLKEGSLGSNLKAGLFKN
ncbi:MAG TPA: hypothetical protein VE933_03090 [Chitinophagaceae bacterium]|nr:hypothetical protein [Chitinophagaceae bacterium]